jgi:hypothetical protein
MRTWYFSNAFSIFLNMRQKHYARITRSGFDHPNKKTALFSKAARTLGFNYHTPERLELPTYWFEVVSAFLSEELPTDRNRGTEVGTITTESAKLHDWHHLKREMKSFLDVPDGLPTVPLLGSTQVAPQLCRSRKALGGKRLELLTPSV